MAKRTVTLTIRAEGLRETLAAFRKLPKDASARLREAAGEIASFMAAKVKANAAGTDAQSAALSATVRVAKDRVPVVQAGGAARVGSGRVPAYRLLFGSEFGADGQYGFYRAQKYQSSEGRQFSPHTGRTGRWFFPTVDAESPAQMRRWTQAADEIVRDFGTGG